MVKNSEDSRRKSQNGTIQFPRSRITFVRIAILSHRSPLSIWNCRSLSFIQPKPTQVSNPIHGNLMNIVEIQITSLNFLTLA
uniref:Uncharacterized protein n=1 Tax=Ascaris lumbricoides TaxID=6252 RepID=A0A0M3IR00_ASCLU